MVILLHREDAYERESPRAGEADLIVAKHRNGPTATVTVAFQGHYSASWTWRAASSGRLRGARSGSGSVRGFVGVPRHRIDQVPREVVQAQRAVRVEGGAGEGQPAPGAVGGEAVARWGRRGVGSSGRRPSSRRWRARRRTPWPGRAAAARDGSACPSTRRPGGSRWSGSGCRRRGGRRPCRAGRWRGRTAGWLAGFLAEALEY